MNSLTTRVCLLTLSALALLLSLPGSSSAQNNYPATLSVPVTFYDFHSDMSNPEFEIEPPSDQVRKGMVGTTLDSEKKPVLGPTPFYNRMISKWFRPWVPGDNQIYNYIDEAHNRDRYTRYSDLPAGLTTVAHDTSFKNIVIQDTLIFNYVPGSQGMYEFSSNDFFPLDGKPGTFGNEDNGHNYSFTMEMHWSFTVVPGLRFEFNGDDDVWAFVNNELVMDIGGIHNPAYGSFNVDNIPGLTPNETVEFDLFYAERHITGSNIKITTNIISPPSNLQLFDNPNPPGSNNPPIAKLPTFTAGSSLEIFGHIFDSTGEWQQTYDNLIEWRLEGATNASLSSTRGTSTSIVSQSSLSDAQITLVATFRNPENPSLPAIEVRITGTISGNKPPVDPPVDPPKPVEHHLDIVLDSAAAKRPESSVDVITFSPENTTRKLIGVIRTEKGEFIRFATDADWRTLHTTIAMVSPTHGANTLLSITNAAIGSQTSVIATNNKLLPDTVMVIIEGEERTGVVPNPFVPGKTDITTYLPQSIVNNYQAALQAAGTNYVTMVVIESPEPLVMVRAAADPRFNSYANVVIYDAVGNVVRDDCTLIAGKEKLTYAATWDGTNRNGRKVGSGAYLMVIQGARLSGQKYTKSHKIGIASRR